MDWGNSFGATDVCHPQGWGDHVASMIPGWPGWQDVFWQALMEMWNVKLKASA